MRRKNRSFLRKLKAMAMGAAMADLALLLLVFFMVATTNEPPKGVEVQVPVGQTEGAEQDNIYIAISADERVFYQGVELSLDELSSRLIERAADKDNVVAITADRRLSYQTIKSVLDILKENDFLNVVFMAEQEK